jgi:hypothetical protein
LPGISEVQNAANGFKVEPDVKLIGFEKLKLIA